MIAETRRLETSASLALAAHATLFGFYLFLKAAEPLEETVKLEQVDFIDRAPPKEAPTPGSGPAMQRAPKSFKDFLHMALPSFKTPAPAEQKLEEAKDTVHQPLEKTFSSSPKISLKRSSRTPLRQALPLRSMSVNAKAAARLSDISPQNAAPAEMARDIPTEKAISLEAVGRVKAAQKTIDFNSAAHFNAQARMRDLPQETGAAPPEQSLKGAEASAINLSAKISRSRGAALPSGGNLPIGYEKGISLKEGSSRLAASALPQVSVSASSLVKNGGLKSVKHKGMEISGPLAGRKILRAYAPRYPDWARRQGVEADTVIRFFVSADGHVLDRMMIERTSGYHRLDQLCMRTLKKMVFAPLQAGSNEVQWGFVTFHFKLK